MSRLGITMILVAGIFLLSSCKKDEVKEMTAEERTLYDSLKVIAFKDIRLGTDSACNAVKDSLYSTYVDSLLTLRMLEIQQLFEETQKK